MKAFRRTTGRVAVLDRADVDTDQIVPKQFLKRIGRTGFGEVLFHDWRADPDFELNRPEYAGASILLAGRNFGCGSSREHAPWALQDYGFEVLIASSFADIFTSNCLKIGLVPVVLPDRDDQRLIESFTAGGELTVDLEEQTVTGVGESLRFPFDSFARSSVLAGLDEIGLTLERNEAIGAHEARCPSGIDTSLLARA